MPKITEKQIRKTIETGRKELLPVFCIVKDRQRNLVTHEERVVYYAVTEPNIGGSLPIRKKDAMALVSLFDMKAFVDSIDGKVYDTPQQSYLNKYHGHNVSF